MPPDRVITTSSFLLRVTFNAMVPKVTDANAPRTTWPCTALFYHHALRDHRARVAHLPREATLGQAGGEHNGCVEVGAEVEADVVRRGVMGEGVLALVHDVERGGFEGGGMVGAKAEALVWKPTPPWEAIAVPL